MAIHERLKQVRLEHGLSQSDLAQIANVSQPTIANWENGGHTPRQEKLESIAQRLDIDLLWLLSGDGEATTRVALPYLSLSIYHLPIYSWPDASISIDSLKPVGFFPFSARRPPRFIFRRVLPGTVRDRMWVIDEMAHGNPDQPYLIIEDDKYDIVTDLEAAGDNEIIGPVLLSLYLYRRSDHVAR